MRFTIDAEGGNTLFPQFILTSYPLIQIQGNDHIILEHFPESVNVGTSHQVRYSKFIVLTYLIMITKMYNINLQTYK